MIKTPDDFQSFIEERFCLAKVGYLPDGRISTVKTPSVKMHVFYDWIYDRSKNPESVLRSIDIMKDGVWNYACSNAFPERSKEMKDMGITISCQWDPIGFMTARAYRQVSVPRSGIHPNYLESAMDMMSSL
jgi:hypothetical protein